MTYKKKTQLGSLSVDNGRKQRSQDALRKNSKKKLSKKILEDRKKRQKEWRQWWS